jgi:hypothetical protein
MVVTPRRREEGGMREGLEFRHRVSDNKKESIFLIPYANKPWQKV